MRQRWEDLLFAHWPVQSAELRRLVPSELEIESFDGTSWVGVVPFRMADVAPRGCPAIPGLSRFPELNLRLYVRHRDRPGVWFLSLDAASRLAVRTARRFFALPYEHARMRCATRVVGERCEVEYSSERLTRDGRRVVRGEGRAVAEPGEQRVARAGDERAAHFGDELPSFRAEYVGLPERVAAEPGSLEHFLTERYLLYSVDRRGRLCSAEVHHAKWPLHAAEARIEHNTIGAPHGLALDGEPALLQFSRRVDVVTWPLRRVE